MAIYFSLRIKGQRREAEYLRAYGGGIRKARRFTVSYVLMTWCLITGLMFLLIWAQI